MRIERSWKPRRILAAGAAFILWVATSIACLAEIWLWGEILLWNLFRFNTELGWLKDDSAEKRSLSNEQWGIMGARGPF